jgi:hypothetical protein
MAQGAADRPRLEIEAHGIEPRRRSGGRHRAPFIVAARQAAEQGGDEREKALVGVAKRDNDQRQHDALLRADRGVAAGQAGEIRVLAGGSRDDGKMSKLHLTLGPGHAAAGEHRIGDGSRRGKAGDRQVEAGVADCGDADQGGAQAKAHFRGGPGHGAGQCLADRRLGIGGYRKARAVAAEHKGKLAPAGGVEHRRDDRRPDHVHRLVAAGGNRSGRIDDIGDADQPVGGQGAVVLRVEHMGEIGERDDRVVETGAACHGRPPLAGGRREGRRSR